ncbi:hypothetical protein JIG36_36615 [Actinoplanes sp. LDG1-06]|uniref:Uncharacterized protein n=1 Tax=Paractinoplanes ovalisporus TaxID=2810368 RepID=A0ABS2ANS2_9ACTN|nr:hypothetical protein [Actinoplanes ovalisporus]MBM2621038.1 hypothetical protein [Actinoplanes ovalisporus]
MTTTSSRSNGTVLAAIITAVAAFLGAVISQPFFHNWIRPWTCTEDFSFDAPANGQSVNGAVGVVVTGKSCDPDDDDRFGWLFEYDNEDQTYYSVSDIPLDGAEWAVMDGPIGDPGDERKTYRLVIVEGGKDCNQALLLAVAKQGWTSFKATAVPAGCEIGPGRGIVVSRAK